MRKEDGDDMIEEKRAKRPRGRGREKRRGEERRVNEDSGKRERGKKYNNTVLFIFNFHVFFSYVNKRPARSRGGLSLSPTARPLCDWVSPLHSYS